MCLHLNNLWAYSIKKFKEMNVVVRVAFSRLSWKAWGAGNIRAICIQYSYPLDLSDMRYTCFWYTVYKIKERFRSFILHWFLWCRSKCVESLIFLPNNGREPQIQSNAVAPMLACSTTHFVQYWIKNAQHWLRKRAVLSFHLLTYLLRTSKEKYLSFFHTKVSSSVTVYRRFFALSLFKIPNHKLFAAVLNLKREKITKKPRNCECEFLK